MTEGFNLVSRETPDDIILIAVGVRIADLEHRVKTLEFSVDVLIRQVKDLKYRLSQDKSVYE